MLFDSVTGSFMGFVPKKLIVRVHSSRLTLDRTRTPWLGSPILSQTCSQLLSQPCLSLLSNASSSYNKTIPTSLDFIGGHAQLYR